MPRYDEDHLPTPTRRPKHQTPPDAEELYDAHCVVCGHETEHILGECLDCTAPRYERPAPPPPPPPVPE